MKLLKASATSVGLFVLLLVLKLTVYVSLSWWIVVAPFWIPLSVCLFVALFIVCKEVLKENREGKDILNLMDENVELHSEVNQLKAEKIQLQKELAKVGVLTSDPRPLAEEDKDRPEKKAPLVEGYKVIYNGSRLCKDCKDETPTCKKLYTGNGTICVEPEEEPKDVINFK